MVKKHVVGGKSALFALALTALLSSLPADNALAEGFPNGKYQFKSLASPKGTYPAGYFTFTVDIGIRNNDTAASWVTDTLEPFVATHYPEMAEALGQPPPSGLGHEYLKDVTLFLKESGNPSTSMKVGSGISWFSGKISFPVSKIGATNLGFLVHEFAHSLQQDGTHYDSVMHEAFADWVRYAWFQKKSLERMYKDGNTHKHKGWVGKGYACCGYFEALRERFNAEHPTINDKWEFLKMIVLSMRMNTYSRFCTETFGYSADALLEMWKDDLYLTGVANPSVLSAADAVAMTSNHVLDLGGATKMFCGSLAGGGKPILVGGTTVKNGVMKVFPLEGEYGWWTQRGATYTIGRGATFQVLARGDQGGQMNFQDGAKLVVDGGCVQADNTRTSYGHCIGCGSATTGRIDIRNGGSFTSSHSYVSLGENGGATGILSVTNGTFVVAKNDLRVAPNSGTTGRLLVDGSMLHARALTLGGVSDGGLAEVDIRNSTLEIGSVAVNKAPRSGSYFKLDGVTVVPNAEGTLFKGFTSSLPLQVGAGGITVSNSYDVSSEALLSGSGAFTKRGSGTFTFNGECGFSGDIQLIEGTAAFKPSFKAASGKKIVASHGTTVSLVFDSGFKSPTESLVLSVNGSSSKVTLDVDLSVPVPIGTEVQVFSSLAKGTALKQLKVSPGYEASLKSGRLFLKRVEARTDVVAERDAADIYWCGAPLQSWDTDRAWLLDGVYDYFLDGDRVHFGVADSRSRVPADSAPSAIYFEKGGIVDGAGGLSSPVVDVAKSVTATIDAPFVSGLRKTGAGTLLLGNFSAGKALNVESGTVKLTSASTVNPLSTAKNANAVKGVLDLGGSSQTFYSSLDSSSAGLIRNGGEIRNGTFAVTPVGYLRMADTTFTVGAGANLVISKASGSNGRLGMRGGARLVVAGGSVTACNAGSYGYVGCDLPASGEIRVTNGGSFRQCENKSYGMRVGWSGSDICSTGIVSVANGTFDLSGTKFLSLASEMNSVAVVAVTNGTLNAGRVVLCENGDGGRVNFTLKNSTARLNGFEALNEPAGGSSFLFDGATLVAVGGNKLFMDDLGCTTVVGPGGLVVTNGYDAVVAAPLSGNGTLTKAGSAALTLSGAQSLQSYVVSAGTLRFADASKKARGASLSVGPGASAVLEGAAGISDFFSTASGKLKVSGLLDIGGAAQTVTGPNSALLNGGEVRNGHFVLAGETLTFADRALTFGNGSDVVTDQRLYLGNNSGAAVLRIRGGTFTCNKEGDSGFAAVGASAGGGKGCGRIEISDGGAFIHPNSYVVIGNGNGSRTDGAIVGSRAVVDIANRKLVLGGANGSESTLALTNSALTCGQVQFGGSAPGAQRLELVDTVACVDSFAKAKVNADSRVLFSGATLVPKTESAAFLPDLGIPVEVAGRGLVVSNGCDVTVSAPLRGSGPLAKSGAGALTLSCKSLPGGALSVNAGRLRLVGGTALSSSSASVAKGAKLEIADAGGAKSVVSGKLTLAGGSALSFANPSPSVPAISVGSLSASSTVDVSVSGVAAGMRYPLVSGVGSVAASVFRLVSCPVAGTLRVQSGTLWLYAGDGFIWTGAGSKNLMSDPKNWLCNIAPTNKADISISVTAATTVVCDIAGFAPRTITFPEGSAAVTVSSSNGGTLAVGGGIVNNGSARHVFGLPVSFAADGEPAPVDVRGAIEFRGGVTGTVPVNHTTFYGKYTLSGTSWKLPASIALAENATIVAEGMTLSVNGKQINAGNGSKLAVGTFESNGSAPFGTFAGTLVAGELISPTGSNSTFNNGFTGVLRTGKIFFYSNNNRRTFTFTPSPSADVVMTGSAGVYAKGSNIQVGGTTFRSATDWTFNTQRHNYSVNSDRTGHILVNSGIVVDTSDYDKPSAPGHTVTVKRDDASENLLSGPGSVTVVGKGRFVFKASSQFTGGLVVSNSVTLSIAKDVAPGNGDVSMAKGTTLEIPYATNGAVTVAGKFDVVAGSGSTVAVRFGTDPVAAVSGRIKVLVAKGGFGKGATASAFSLANMAPSSEKAKFSIVSAEGGGQELWVEARSGSVWTGSGSDARWTNTGNWIFGAKPEGGDAAYFMDGAVVKAATTFPGAASGGNVYVNAGTSAAPVTFSATGAAANGLSAGSLYVGTTSGGTTPGALWLNGGSYSFSGVSYVGTDASMTGWLKLGGGNVSTEATFPDSYLHVRPGSSVVGANATLSAKSFEMNGSAENEGGNWTFDYISVANAASSDASIVLRGGTLTARGYFDIGQNANAVGARVEIVDGMVTNTACYIHLGAYCPGVLTVRKGGKYGMSSNKYGLIVGGRESGTLNVAGGDVFVNGPLNLSFRKGKAKVNVTDEGVLTYGYVNFGGGVSGAGGNSEIAVDGGTLRALANNAAFLPANDAIAVTVGTKGCTVDNNGKNVTIAKSVAGKGAVRFIGKGTTKLASGQLYTGDTSVAGGTTLSLAVAASTPALAGSLTPDGGATIAVPEGGVTVAGKFVKGSGVSADSPVRVTVGNGGKLAAGSYKILAASSLPGDDPQTYMVLSNAVPAGHKAVFRKDGNAVFVDVVKVYVWKRSVTSGNLSVASNWEGGVVPPAGSHVEIGTDSSATLTCDIAEFAPSCIMFPVGSQKVTIAGSGAVAKVRAIKNYASGVHHVFNVPVSFAEGVLADVSLGSSNYVEFRRGMTAYDVKQTGEGTYYYGQFRYLGANIVRSNRDWVYLPKFSSTTLRLNGMRMEGKGANIDLRAGTKLVVDGNVALVGGAGEMRRPYWRNYGGTFSASGVMTLSGGANGEPCDGNSSGVLAVDGLRNESAGRFYLNTAGSGFSSPWRIGASGLTASNGSGGFVVKPQRPATLNAMANYSIAAPIAVSNTLYVGTTCATSSVPRTVTVAAQLSGTGSLAVTGAGTLRLTKDCGLAGGIAVTNSATLRVDEGVKSVAGNLSLGTGTAVYIGTPSGVPARLAVADAAIGNGVAVRLGSTIVKRGVYPVLTKTGGGSFTQADLAKLSLDCSAVPELAGVAHLVLGGTGNDSICISTLRHGVWVGGNGNFGDAANWEDGVVPSVGDALFFNEIASNVKVSAPSSSRAVKYGVATMGGKVVTFSGNIAFAGISDTSKVSVDANATVTLDGDLVFANATSGANNYIVNTVGANGAFVVTGRIVSSADGFGYVLPSVNAGDGVIVAKGLVQNSSNSDNPSFRLARDAGSTTRWAIGRDGITGSKNYWILNNNNHPRAEIRPLDSDFTISAKIGNREKATLVLDTTGRDGLAHTIKLTGGTYREGVNIVKGTGKVVCDYIAPSGNASNKFSVEGSATLVLKAGSNIGSGKVTVNAGATLLAENAAGGSITLPALEITAGGTLAVLNGGSAPAIKATSFKVLAGASGAKVSVIIGSGTVGVGTYTVLSASSITANTGDFLLENVASGCTASFSKSGNSLVVAVASSGGTPKSFVETVNAAPVAALSESQRRARVLNLDLTKADAAGEVTIKAIRVDGKKVEVDVVLERRGAVQKDGVDAPINGVLKLYAVDLATGGQTLVAGAQVDDPTFANGDTATFTFETSVPAGFYKAVIDEE